MREKTVFLTMPGTRVYLRPVEKSDLEFFQRTINDPEICTFLIRHDPFTDQDEENWYNNLPQGRQNSRICSIVLKEDELLIGNISLNRIDWVNGTSETGSIIGRTELHGKGLGSEAKMLWLKYAFHELNLRQIYSRALASNRRSVRYSEKCGYRKVGLYPKAVRRNGEYDDLVHLMVDESSWLPLWKEFEERMKGAVNETKNSNLDH